MNLDMNLILIILRFIDISFINFICESSSIQCFCFPLKYPKHYMYSKFKFMSHCFFLFYFSRQIKINFCNLFKIDLCDLDLRPTRVPSVVKINHPIKYEVSASSCMAERLDYWVRTNRICQHMDRQKDWTKTADRQTNWANTVCFLYLERVTQFLWFIELEEVDIHRRPMVQTIYIHISQ